IQLRVTDSGEGIPDEVKDKIFEPFFTTKDTSGGTGIGLALSTQIVHEHEGSIDFSSRAGSGTSFTLAFKKSNVTPANKVKKIVGGEDHLLSGDVIIAEDEIELCEILTYHLEDMGLTVHAASCGSEALTLLQKNPDQYDLLITDLKMPNMRGTELVTSLRESGHDRLKMVISTGGSYEDLAQDPNFDQKSIDGMLLKPFSKNDVHDLVTDLLNRKGKKYA
ncbi:response regulator, partial [Oligoflexaceae bacterium]|nr:response regulator [Oligoflexaceae bacterium]